MISENLANPQLIENLSLTLLHSVWQIAFVAFWLFLALRVSSKFAANLRYVVSLAALVLSVVLPIATFIWLSNNSANAAQNFTAFDANSPAISKPQPQPAEDFLPNKNAKTADAENKNYFVSIENLQNNLATNVSMDEAQADEAYQTPDDFSGKAGVSWFERWQLAQGKKLRSEPSVSKSISDIWDNRK